MAKPSGLANQKMCYFQFLEYLQKKTDDNSNGEEDSEVGDEGKDNTFSIKEVFYGKKVVTKMSICNK